MFNLGKWAVFTLKKSPIFQGERFLPIYYERVLPYRPHIFFGDIRFSLETPYFYWRLPDFHWRPKIFAGDAQIFIEDPGFSLDTPVFCWRPKIFNANLGVSNNIIWVFKEEDLPDARQLG